MRTLQILLLGLILVASSCNESSELDIQNETIDFTGTYIGNLDCSGTMEYETGLEVTIIVTEIADNKYFVDFGDDVIFEGYVDNNELLVDKQTINKNQGFDEVTMELKLVHILQSNFAIKLAVEVDDEGSSACDFELTKNN